MAAIMEVTETMNKKFLQFEPAPRRGEPEVRVQPINPLCCTILGGGTVADITIQPMTVTLGAHA